MARRKNKWLYSNDMALVTIGSSIVGDLLDKPRLSTEEQDLAKLSSEVYQSVDQRKNVNDYRHDREFSGPDHSVYVRKDGVPVIAWRGTKNKDDISADFDILLGTRQHPRFRKAEMLERKVREKYGTAPLLTGHSLGGYIANHVSLKNDNAAVVFNPGSNPLRRERVGRRTKVIRKRGDLISAGFGKSPGLPSVLGTLVTHGVRNFF